MALKDLMMARGVQPIVKDVEITPETVKEYMPQLRRLVSFWRCYNDKFIDYLCSLNPNNTFSFYFYQRVYLRACSRYKYIYATFPRAYSKSFLAVMCLMIRCVLYPGVKIFVVSGGKEQSAGIVSQKVNEICRLIPAFSREIIWTNRGVTGTERTKQTKDSVAFSFKNGSVLENVAASEHTRGRRFHSGLMEECIGIDEDMLNQVIIPTLNVERRVNGKVDPNEWVNQSQIFVNFCCQNVIKS